MGSVEDSPNTRQPDIASRVDPVQINPVADEGPGEAPGVVVLLPL